MNDNSPVFKLPTYSIRLPENSANDRSLLDLKATDADSEQNGRVYYELSQVSDWRTPNPFLVDADGQLRLQPGMTLDREAVSQYSFDVVARDRGSPQRTSTASVTITVTGAPGLLFRFYMKCTLAVLKYSTVHIVQQNHNYSIIYLLFCR